MRDIHHIIQGCKANNRQSQNDLYVLYAPILYPICMRYASSKQEAEDLLHDGFMRIYKKIDTYNGNGSFEGWLKRLVVFVCIDDCRKRMVHYNIELLEIPDDDMGDEVEAAPSIHELMRVLQSLSPIYRAVFNMYIIDGLSHREISKELGMSESTSRSNLTRAKQQLKHHLSMHTVEN